MRARSALALLAVWGATACTLLVAQLRDEREPAAERDAGTALADAARDAEAVGEDGQRRFCADADVGQFCADFDEGPIAAGWTRLVEDPRVQLGRQPSSVSPPWGFRMEVESADAGAVGVSAFLARDLVPGTAPVRAVECALVVEQLSESPPLALATLTIGTWSGILGAAATGTLELAEYRSAPALFVRHATSAALVAGQPTPIGIRFETVPGDECSIQLEIRARSVPVLRTCLELKAPLAQVGLRLGVGFMAAPFVRWKVAYDNVLCSFVR